LIPCEEEGRVILFILEIGSLKKIVDCIVEGRGIILWEGIILQGGDNDGERYGLGEEVLKGLGSPYLL
jgi:hypothetical protein